MRRVLDRFRAVDLSHELHEQIPTWSGGCGYRLEVKLDYPQGLCVQSLKSHAGVGTHIDAPSHFFDNSLNVGEIALENLIVPVCVLDLRQKMDPNLFVLPQDLELYEKTHGKIAENSLVLANTGWSQFWIYPDQYRNVQSDGKMHFPGFSESAALFLIERNVVGLGIDTLSPDGSTNGPGVRYPVHESILGAKKYILENLANLEQMPPRGAFALVMPPRSRDATESAARVVGLISSD
ncbi:MAG: cyclase [Chlamydiae bacterium CG10_big_fil_rev_8_21_14_0_10_42_34]|nr:MAG: cyclase [Chlamydiae bacterium CG10_big_fil_rev_8_21_14_0_10_42_34]